MRKLFCLVVVLSGLLLAMFASAATAALVWPKAGSIGAPLGAAPGNASPILTGVSCTGVGDCLAVGHYTNSSGNAEMMVVAESDGVWGQAAGIPVPGDPNAALIGVSCTSAGNCVAVGNGSYADGPGKAYTYQQAILVTETNGVWGQPTAPVLPSGYSPIDAVAALNSVLAAAPAIVSR